MSLSVLLLIHINYIGTDFKVKHPMLYFLFSFLSFFAFIKSLSIFILCLKKILYIIKGYILNIVANSRYNSGGSGFSNNSSNNQSGNNGNNHNNNNLFDINEEKEKEKKDRYRLSKKKYNANNKAKHA